jgi:GT2 family glycosyltransferase
MDPENTLRVKIMELKVKKEFGFLILNYLNYQDTIELINNLSSQSWFHQINLYVVDNNSHNNSVIEIEKVKSNVEFTFLRSKKNSGFAIGENIAFKKALEDECKFIVSINSDTLIDNSQVDFLNRIREIYNKNANIGLITIDIKNLDGIRQNPLKEKPPSIYKVLILKLFFSLYLHKIYFFLRVYLLHNLVNIYVERRDLIQSKKDIKPNLLISRYIYAAQGSFICFTPSYLKYFSGHNEATFLFFEEFIRAEELMDKDLLTWLEMDLRIVHKESKSISMVATTKKARLIFLLKNMFESGKIYAKILKIRK